MGSQLEGEGENTASAAGSPFEGEGENTACAVGSQLEGEEEHIASAVGSHFDGEGENTASAVGSQLEGEEEHIASAVGSQQEGEGENTASAVVSQLEGELEVEGGCSTKHSGMHPKGMILAHSTSIQHFTVVFFVLSGVKRNMMISVVTSSPKGQSVPASHQTTYHDCIALLCCLSFFGENV